MTPVVVENTLLSNHFKTTWWEHPSQVLEMVNPKTSLIVLSSLEPAIEHLPKLQSNLWVVSIADNPHVLLNEEFINL